MWATVDPYGLNTDAEEECCEYWLARGERLLFVGAVTVPRKVPIAVPFTGRIINITVPGAKTIQKFLNHDLGHHDIVFVKVCDGVETTDLTFGLFADDFAGAALGAAKEAASHLVWFETDWDNAGTVPGTIKDSSTTAGPYSKEKKIATKEEYEDLLKKAQGEIDKAADYHLYKSNCQNYADSWLK